MALLNYRVIEVDCENGKGKTFDIYKIEYDSEGQPFIAYSVFIGDEWDSIEDLKNELSSISAALDKPVLRMDSSHKLLKIGALKKE